MENHIVLDMQIVRNLKTKSVVYGELLIREYDGVKGVKQILKKVAQDNKELEMDMRVLECALEYTKNHRHMKYPLGVNLCGKSIEHDGVVDIIEGLFQKYEVEKSSIIIEVNELSDFESQVVKNNLQLLKDRQYNLALDDFGAGKTNLQSVINNVFKFVKIDKVLVDNIGSLKNNDNRELLLKATKYVADSTGVEPIVEGIETKDDLEKIQGIGLHNIQGYITGRPVRIINKVV